MSIQAIYSKSKCLFTVGIEPKKIEKTEKALDNFAKRC